MVGVSLVRSVLNRPRGVRFTRTLLGINVSGQDIGGAGQAFVYFVGFFMPFVFVSSTVRWRCQKAGLVVPVPPKASDYQQ